MSVDVAVLITEASPADFLNPPPSLSPSPSPSPPRPPAAAPAPPQPTFPRTPASATAPELERKIARLKTEFQIRDRSRQKRNEIFQSLKQSDHTKMLQLMDANEKINRLEAELQMTKNNNVIWLRRAEKFKAERYMRFAPLLDQIPTIPPPRAIEWGILARQVEFWVGVVVFIMLLAAIYAVGRYLGNYAPAIPCTRPPRIENHWPQSLPIVECPPIECPRVPDCLTGTDLPTPAKCRGNRHLIAAFFIGAVTGGFNMWQTVKAMD